PPGADCRTRPRDPPARTVMADGFPNPAGRVRSAGPVVAVRRGRLPCRVPRGPRAGSCRDPLRLYRPPPRGPMTQTAAASILSGEPPLAPLTRVATRPTGEVGTAGAT